MQQSFMPPDHTTLSLCQKWLMGISSGLLLAAIEFVLGFALFYFHIDYIQLGPLPFIGIVALLYFVAPIPLSFYISRQTDNVTEGWKVGRITGCSGAILIILIIVIYAGVLIYGMLPDTYRGGWTESGLIYGLFPIIVFLNAFGMLFGLLGSAVGSGLGKIGKRNAS